MSFEIDRIDERILYRLVEDARHTSAPDIAEEVDVTDTTIRNRIDRLEANGAIRGYHAAVDYERTADLLTTLFVCTTRTERREKLAKEVLGIPGVVNVREVMTGHGDLHVKAVGGDTEDLTRIASELSSRGVEVVSEELLRQEYHAPYRPFGPGEEPEAPSLTDFLSLRGGAEVVELTVAEGAPITEWTLAEANERGILTESDLVLTVERDGTTITPRGEVRLRSGDVVRLFSQNGVPTEVVSTIAGGERTERDAPTE